MRVVYLGAFRLPNYDAAAARVLGIATAILATGKHTVDFISWGGKYRDSDKCSDGKYRVHGCSYVITNEIDTIGSPIKKIIGRLTRGCKTMRLLRLSEPFDVVIAYNPDLSLTLQMMRYCKKTGARLVSDLTEWYASGEIPLTDVLPNWFNMKFLQDRVKYKICISSYLDKYYHNTNNVVIPATCNAQDEKWSQPAPRELLSSDEMCKTLIYAGSPAKKDLLSVVVKAVSDLIIEGADLRFIIVGIAAEDYQRRFGIIPKDVLSSGRLLFLGRQPQDRIPSFYKAADFMVLLRENTRKSNAGFPTKVAESFMSGVPVITNATSDIMRYVVDGETGFLLDSHNVSALKTILRDKVLKLSVDEQNALKTKTKNKSYLFNSVSYTSLIEKILL